MKILHKWLYHERIIFLCEFEDGYHLFYKSSGLAGHGTQGQVFPILRLKDTVEYSPDGLGEWMSFGWLPKYFLYRGRFEEYRAKARSEFPKIMYPIMDELEAIDNSDAVLEPDPRIINAVCNQYIKSKNDYKDWYYGVDEK